MKRNNNNQLLKSLNPRAIRPPPYNPNTGFTKKMRFQVTSAAVAVTITAAQVAESMGITCTTTNASGSCLVQSFRIKSIEIWGTDTTVATNNVNTVSIVWATLTTSPNEFASNREVSDTSTSSAYCPYIKAIPPKRSNVAMWNNQSLGGARNSSGIFTITAPVGSIVDLVAEVVLWDLGPTTAKVTTALNTATLTAFAYLPLDGLGGNIRPVSANFFS